LQADADVDMVMEMTERIKERALEEKPKPGLTTREHVLNIVYEELVRFLGKEKNTIELRKQNILLVGLFGCGKTTTAGKLAKFFQTRGLKTALVGCDVIRPAAAQQLEQIAKKAGVPVYIDPGAKDARKIAKTALERFKGKDVLIIDSSGRNALDKDMIEEIKNLDSIIQPDQRLLVIPADLGQQARAQAEAMQKAIDVTGIILTRLDGTAKGGGALAACAATGAPVLFIGTGEKLDDLEEYDPTRFVSNLIGLGDLQGLLAKAKEVGAEEKAKKIIAEGLTLETFYEQLEAMQKMAPLEQLVEMIPGFGKIKLPAGYLQVQEEKMRKWKYIIDSMTRTERKNPTMIDASRIARIARGSGTDEAEVRELLKNYNQVRKLMRMTKGGLKRGALAQLVKQLGVKI
jgi:signal recognition particle subunit SRP54